MIEKREPPRNALLRSLSASDLGRICVFLQRAELRPLERLPEENTQHQGVWFPESGFISVLVRDERGVETEVAMIGREGAAGILEPVPGRAMNYQFMAQQRGIAHFIAADQLQTVVAEAPALHEVLTTASAALLDQVAGTAHSNARGRVVQRLARWLLMAHDRVDSDVLFMTHDILAAMLGVRRVGVTNALHVLEGERLIRAYRGRIRLLDREGLIAMSNALYRPPQRRANGSWGAGDSETSQRPPQEA